MMRTIIHIDESLCDGCGMCVSKCAESALKIVDGKARLVSESFCDGLGACIGECPRGAIAIETREAPAFDEKSVQTHLELHSPCSCPGSSVWSRESSAPEPENTRRTPARSELASWPVQLALVPVHAPFLRGADLLVCADCVPFALPDFHHSYLKGRMVLVGCPKLDDIGSHRVKLREIFRAAAPSSVTVLRMEVPCCGGIAQAVVDARNEVCPDMAVDIVTVVIDGGVSSGRIPPVPGQRA
jgi:NAD-dependent dihydropyrimidine dehydrogenase PreA subunit